MTDTPARHALAKAALDFVAKHEGTNIRLHDLAALAGRPIGDFYPLGGADVFDCVEEFFDRAVAEALSSPDRAAPARDRVFDAAMARFEAMERRRPSVLVLYKMIDRDPLAQASRLARDARTARWLMTLAGEDGPGMAVRAQGLALVLRDARAAWRRDEAGDFAKTMAALDSGLRRMESLFANFGKMAESLRPSRRDEAANAAPREDRPGAKSPG